MESTRTRSSAAVWLGAAALVAYIGRAMLDWRYVYPEQIDPSDMATTAIAMAVYLAISLAWIWALFAARDGRRAGYLVLAGLAALTLVALGASTWFVLCPFPCDTAAPVGEAINTGGTLIGIAGLVASIRAARS